MIMTPTDRPQKPRECEHYLGVAKCEFQDEATLNPETICVLFCGEKHCPDFARKLRERWRIITSSMAYGQTYALESLFGEEFFKEDNGNSNKE